MLERQVDLFMKLCVSNQYLPASYFAKQYRVSQKTIYKDINALLDVLKNTNLEIIKKRRLGLKLIGDNSDKKKVLLRITNESSDNKVSTNDYSPRIRRANLVKQIILDAKKVTLQESSQKWLVSKTSILNDISKINAVIATAAVQIESDGITLSLMTNEENRQIAAISYIVETSKKNFARGYHEKYLKLFFQDRLLSVTENIFLENKKKWFKGLPSYYQYSVFLLILVQVHRANLGLHFKNISKSKLDNANGVTFDVAKNFLHLIGQKLEIVFLNTDVERLARNFAAYRIGSTEYQEKQDWSEVIRELIIRMESIQNTKFMKHSQLYNQLLYHIPAMIRRLEKGMVVKNPLLGDIKRQYPELFGMTWYVLSFLEERFNISLNDDEVSFVTIYFHMSINGAVKKNRILIILNQHGTLNDYIIAQIKSLLPDDTEYQVRDYAQFETEKGNNDLIIGVNTPSLVTSTPFVNISPLMDASDQAKLLRIYVDKVIERPNKQKSMKYSILPQILTKDLIFFDKQFRNKDEVLNFVTRQLEKLDMVAPEFRSSIFRRERIGSTEIGGGVALPHATPEAVKKSGVVFLIMPKPIWWNTENVNIVILTCVPNEEISIYQNLVMDIYNLVGQKDKAAAIAALTSADDLIKIIKG